MHIITKIKYTLVNINNILINLLQIKINKHLRENREQKIVAGNLHPDKIFYVIRRFPHHAGFFSNYHHVLGHLKTALRLGYLPIVDMENYKTSYDEESKIFGTNNTWEYYFDQPCPYTLEEVYKSKNVILSDGAYPHKMLPSDFRFVYNKAEVTKHNLLISSYIKLRPEVKKILDERYNAIISFRQGIMGVLSRGTDMNTSMGHGHKKMPDKHELLTQAKMYMAKWEAEWIFLVTEEEDVLTEFKRVFKDKLLYSDNKRVSQYDGKTPINQIKFNRENDNFNNGLDCLIDIYLLSNCESLLCPLTNGSVAAIEINGGKYKNTKILDYGVLDVKNNR